VTDIPHALFLGAPSCPGQRRTSANLLCAPFLWATLWITLFTSRKGRASIGLRGDAHKLSNWLSAWAGLFFMFGLIPFANEIGHNICSQLRSSHGTPVHRTKQY
jgi:hypothetical protein